MMNFASGYHVTLTHAYYAGECPLWKSAEPTMEVSRPSMTAIGSPCFLLTLVEPQKEIIIV